MTGTELRALRLAHGLSQAKLAELLGYSVNYIYRLERAEHLKDDRALQISPRLEKAIRAILAQHRPTA